MLQQAKVLEHSQRVQVELERHASGNRVKIRVESHDEGLGWYTSGGLTLPLEELPLLEQAIQEMRSQCACERYGVIIPFPGLEAEPAKQAVE